MTRGRIGTGVMIRPTLRAVALLCCLATPAACSSSRDDRIGLSADEDRQLNEAAAQLDAAGNAAPPDNESFAP